MSGHLLVVLHLLLAQAAAPGNNGLSVREDPVLQGNILVGVTPETQATPLDVVWYPAQAGAKPVAYRSPDGNGFNVCAFLREVGAARVRGPHDVVVRRADVATRIRLDYDGRTCLKPYPTPAVSAPKRRDSVLPTPLALPVPIAVIGPVIEEWRPSEALVERVSIVAEGSFLIFRVEFDRNLKLDAGAKVLVRKLLRIDQGTAVIKDPVAFRVSREHARVVAWKVPASLVRFDPPLGAPERFRLSFTLDDKEFDGYTVTVGKGP